MGVMMLQGRLGKAEMDGMVFAEGTHGIFSAYRDGKEE
jgi:hypothetical protein